MESKWGTPPHIAMAIMKQESSFVADALPPRAYLLWVIPWGRVSPSYGYAQAQPPIIKYDRARDDIDGSAVPVHHNGRCERVRP